MSPRRRPRWQRIAAYAVIVRDDQILLSRLAPRLTRAEKWTLPGGGIEHGENPRDSVVREVAEETGLDVTISDTARVYSLHLPHDTRDGRKVDAHSMRIVFEGWVPPDAPEPRVVEVDGSTADARWHPIADVLSGKVPTVALVREALAEYEPFQQQRLAAYALILRGDDVLLTRISPRGFHSGSWTLPGGGVDHGETPAESLAREVREECGLDAEVGELLTVHDVHFSGVAPSGRFEDFHGVHLVFAATVAEGSPEPRVVELDGTTDDVAWVPRSDIESGAVEVLDLVRSALAAHERIMS